jgi:uncharacterized protein YbaP (TraB family)
MKNIKLLTVFIAITTTIQAHSQLIWEISSKKTNHKSYLIGTHPLVPAVAFDSLIQVYKIFNKSDILLSTYDNYSIDAETLLKKMAILPFNKTAKDYLNDTSYTEIDLELKRTLKLSIKDLGRLNPYMINQMYLAELFSQAINIKDDLQTDSYFQRVANAQNRKIIGLENYEAYLTELLGPEKTKQHAQALTQNVLNKISYQKVFQKFYSAYCNNDLKSLSELMSTYSYLSTETAAINNTIELPKNLVSLLRENRCFYIVDISQLIGQTKLLQKLKHEGFDLKPI